MRTRTQIECDGTRKDILALEVLLDIRELLIPIKAEGKPIPITILGKRKLGRPKGKVKKNAS